MLAQIFLFIIFIYAILTIFNKISSPPTNKLPPGPWGLPILGHLPLLGSSPHKTLLKWRQIYGPIMMLRFGSFPTLVLNDVKLIKEVAALPSFAGRGDIKALKAASKNKGLSWCDGPWQQEQRQFVLRNLGKDFDSGRKTIEMKILEEISDFMQHFKNKVATTTNGCIKVNGIFTASAVNGVWSAIIGERFEFDDPQIRHVAYLVGERLSRSDTIFSKLAMFLPLLNTLLPNLSGYNEKIAAFNEIFDYVDDRIGLRKKSWVKGHPRDFTDAYLDKVEETTDVTSSFHKSHDVQKITTADLLMAAVETSSTTLEWTVNLLARHQHVQSKVQAEIDEVIGHRLPCLNDLQQMPYTAAVLLEIGRLTSTLPWGVFRKTMDDVELDSYRIPKDTMVVTNLYGIHRGPEWGDPHEFRPSRFLTGGNEQDDDTDKVKGKREWTLVFGHGRRSCPGEILAKEQLFLFTVSLCQNFHMKIPIGEDDMTKEFFGFTLQPHPFYVEFSLRN